MSPARLAALVLAALAVVLAAGACGGSSANSAGGGPAGSPPDAATPAAQTGLVRWPVFIHVRHPLDLAGPLRDGSLVMWANGRLFTLRPSGRISPFARSYYRPGNAEPYIAAPAPGHGGCSFGSGTVYVLRLYGGRGVVAVRRGGPVRRLASITAPGLIDGIAFDETGRFGHRLLVTINDGLRTTVDAIDCHGRVSTITRTAPRVEGGIVVARPPFGGFTGDLIAPDEKSGRIYAITPGGRSVLIARSGLPYGQDVGVESEVQVPDQRRYHLLGADRLTPGNRHPGDNALLRAGSAALIKAGVRPGDVLVATEGGARVVDVSCRASCSVREVADGPAEAHLEGHLAITLP